MPDSRRTPARPDLAAAHLQGIVPADRYAAGERMTVHAAIAPLRREPRLDAPLDTEALYGEIAIVYEHDVEGWSWVQLVQDQYVGYLPSAALSRGSAQPTHRVQALRTLAFPGPSIKLPPAMVLPMGAALVVTGTDSALARTDDGFFVPASHLCPAGAYQSDVIAVALQFVGTPYLWGGRTSLGIDCSGLVQTALAACGITAPRDSDMQEAELGALVGTSLQNVSLQRGDLLFWKGHVAMACDGATIVHANAHHMAVATESADAAVARIAAAGAPLTAIKRLRAEA